MLRTRLFLNLAPFVVLLLAVGVYAIVLFARLGSRLDATVAGNYRSLLAAQAMRLEVAGMEREVWASTGTTNSPSLSFIAHQQQFETNLAMLSLRAAPQEHQELYGHLATNYQAFTLAVAEFNAAADAEGRRHTYQLEIVPSALAVDNSLERIRDLHDQAIRATPEAIQTITNDITRLMILGMVFTLIVASYVCYQLGRSILTPIQSLTNATRELGEGKVNLPIPVVSRDELGELAQAFNKLAAQLHEYRQSTAEEIVRLHRTMETTLASYPDPIFVMDQNGRIELKNHAGEIFAGTLGLNDRLPARLQAIAETVLAKDENFLPHSFDEVACYQIGDAEKFFLPRVLAMHDKQGALFGVAVVLYDVTRFRLLDAAKTNLVATVSHELKTPLTGVRMALHILLEHTLGPLRPKQEELVQGARNDAERLLRILNNLLDLARLDEGHAGLRKEPVAPADLLQGVIKETAHEAAGRAVRMQCVVAPELPAVPVDRQRISHVFANLVRNAIKHSPDGDEIILRAAHGEDGGVQFSVDDRGPGVPEEYHARIFDRFFRVPGQDKSGAGLGLSIAREITVAHGGRIGVRSSPGQGSSFYVVLPAEVEKS